MVLEPTPGGECRFSWKNWGPDFYTHEVPGTIIRIEPPNIFEFSWGSGDNSTSVKFTMEADYGGTVLTITEEGYLDTPRHRAAILECASGWGEAATLLKFYIEHRLVYRKPIKVNSRS